MLGTHKRAPTVGEVIDSLKDPVVNAIINLVGVTGGTEPLSSKNC